MSVAVCYSNHNEISVTLASPRNRLDANVMIWQQRKVSFSLSLFFCVGACDVNLSWDSRQTHSLGANCLSEEVG